MKSFLTIALLATATLNLCAQSHTKTASKAAQPASHAPWTFAYSGDSRNCGDFVMPAIAAQVRAEGDLFYWHLGDFRLMNPFSYDQDMVAMRPAGDPLTREEYNAHAWDDFLEHQLASFGTLPVFLGRGNHEANKPMTRQGYIDKFSKYINNPEIAAQRAADGPNAAPIGPWYHWIRDGVDFITLDNSTRDEFTAEQLAWLRALLDRDLKPDSGIRTIITGMHEALPHSTGSNHAMDDWELGIKTGETVYGWLYDAQQAGKHVYILASHSHYYSPNVFNSTYWRAQNKVVPGWIMGAAGAHRSKLPKEADPASREHFYGYMQGRVNADGTIDFTLHELSEEDLVKAKWPNAPLDAIHECYVHNFE
jgi:hypothetical protein